MVRIGAEVVRFQEASAAFDDIAAEILALDRRDLPCMTLLLFEGPTTVDDIAVRLQMRRGVVMATLERLQLAGYARRQPGARSHLEVTEHAREWIEKIWGPLQQGGMRLMNRYSTRQLALLEEFMRGAGGVQDVQSKALRTWLSAPASPARRTHLRGGLSPAALRRVQLFVEANLQRTIHLRDLAERAALSTFHFARAFKTSAGVTPRGFIEQRRIARARQLIEETGASLSDIAVEAGFGSQSRLTTTFKRRTGFTPAEYRRGYPRDARGVAVPVAAGGSRAGGPRPAADGS